MQYTVTQWYSRRIINLTATFVIAPDSWIDRIGTPLKEPSPEMVEQSLPCSMASILFGNDTHNPSVSLVPNEPPSTCSGPSSPLLSARKQGMRPDSYASSSSEGSDDTVTIFLKDNGSASQRPNSVDTQEEQQ